SLLRPLPHTISTLVPYTTLFRSNTEYRDINHTISPEPFRLLTLRMPGERTTDVLVSILQVSFWSRRRITYSQASRGRPSHYIYLDRKSTRLNSSHVSISYAVFCL